MKKYLLVTSLFCLANLFAQNKVAEKVSELQGLKASFRPISVLTVTQNTIDSDINKVVDGATCMHAFAIHPDFRGQNLARGIVEESAHWFFSDNCPLNIESITE